MATPDRDQLPEGTRVVMDDESIVRRCLAGDRDAFGELVTRYEGPLYHVSLRILRDREEARDATQTTFLKAWRSLHTFDGHHRFFSWIYRIAMNEALNRATRNKRHDTLDPALPDGHHGPDREIELDETKRRVQAALMTLPEAQRDVIVLRHWLDLSYEEIADRIGVPLKTVKSRLFEARRRLAGRLDPTT